MEKNKMKSEEIKTGDITKKIYWKEGELNSYLNEIYFKDVLLGSFWGFKEGFKPIELKRIKVYLKNNRSYKGIFQGMRSNSLTDILDIKQNFQVVGIRMNGINKVEILENE